MFKFIHVYQQKSTRVTMSQHESDTNQHDSDMSQQTIKKRL